MKVSDKSWLLLTLSGLSGLKKELSKNKDCETCQWACIYIDWITNLVDSNREV